MAEGVFMVNQSGIITLCNKAAEEILGFSAKEMIGAEIFGRDWFFTCVKGKKLTLTLEETPGYITLQTGKPMSQFRIGVMAKNESMVCASINTRAIFKSASSKKPDEMVITFHDITKQLQIEEDIKQYQEDLKSLTSKLILVEEKHRREIATNLHDHLSQTLVLAKIKTDEIVAKKKSKTQKNELLDIGELLKEAIHKSRKLTYDLSPPVLYELGLIEAIEYLLEKMKEDHGLDVVFKKTEGFPGLPEENIILIYRSINELLTNVVKHADASSVEIGIEISKNQLCFFIKDNGKGFNTEILNKHSLRGKGFGLFSIKERLEIGRASCRERV